MNVVSVVYDRTAARCTHRSRKEYNIYGGMRRLYCDTIFLGNEKKNQKNGFGRRTRKNRSSEEVYSGGGVLGSSVRHRLSDARFGSLGRCARRCVVVVCVCGMTGVCVLMTTMTTGALDDDDDDRCVGVSRGTGNGDGLVGVCI